MLIFREEKKMKNQSASRGGIGFSGILTIVFITLKLLKVINWSWLWVLSPLWIYWAVIILIVLVIAIAK